MITVAIDAAPAEAKDAVYDTAPAYAVMVITMAPVCDVQTDVAEDHRDTWPPLKNSPAPPIGHVLKHAAEVSRHPP